MMPVMGLVGAVAALVAARPLYDNSFLTHLATGRLMLTDGIPARNPFLFTGTEFPVPSWWWSIILALTERLGGATALRLLTAAVAFAVGAVIVRLTSGGGLLAAVVPAGLAIFCLFAFLNARPHLVGFLLLGLTLVFWKERRPAWWMVPVFAVWVNVHGSWLYGAAVLALLAVTRMLDERRWDWSDVRRGIAAVSGVLLGGVLYPTTMELVLLPARQFGDPIERQALQVYKEWARVPIDNPLLWALIAMGGIALLGALRSRQFGAAAVSVLMVVFGWSGGRLLPIAAITLVPFAAHALRGVGSLGLPEASAARRCWLATGVLLIATVTYVLVTPGYRLDRYPVEAVDWLESRGLVANSEVRLVSHDYVGNYLEWRYGSDANAYVDDRPDARTLVQYSILMRLGRGWADQLADVDPDVVLWNSTEGLDDELAGDDSWIQGVELGDFTVFCRKALADRCN